MPPNVSFKAKMQQIRFPLGPRLRPRWGSLQRSRRCLAVNKGPTSKGRERREGEGRRRGRRKREGKGFAGPLSNCFLRACLMSAKIYWQPVECLFGYTVGLREAAAVTWTTVGGCREVIRKLLADGVDVAVAAESAEI